MHSYLFLSPVPPAQSHSQQLPQRRYCRLRSKFARHVPIRTRKPLAVANYSTDSNTTTTTTTPATQPNNTLTPLSVSDTQSRAKIQVHVHGLISKRLEKENLVETQPEGIRERVGGFLSQFRPKAYWDSMGIIPYFALFGITILTIKLVRVALGLKESEKDEGPRWSMAAATTEEEQSQLHEFKCGGCGYVMYPARGREGKFFPESFKCPLCQSPKSMFWDLRDPNDPRNQEEAEDEGKEKVVTEGVDEVDLAGGATVEKEEDTKRDTGVDQLYTQTTMTSSADDNGGPQTSNTDMKGKTEEAKDKKQSTD